MTPNEVPRKGTEEPPAGQKHRLSDILGVPVVRADGNVLGHVNDVRLAPTAVTHGVFPELVVDGLVVSDRHAGSMLGYDRRSDQGPWLVRAVVRLVHRRAGYASWDTVTAIDWAAGRVTTSLDALQPLTGPSDR